MSGTVLGVGIIKQVGHVGTVPRILASLEGEMWSPDSCRESEPESVGAASLHRGLPADTYQVHLWVAFKLFVILLTHGNKDVCQDP